MNKYVLDCSNMAENKIYGIKSHISKDVLENMLKDVVYNYILSNKEDCKVAILDCMIGGDLYFSDIISVQYSSKDERKPSFVLDTLDDYFEELF